MGSVGSSACPDRGDACRRREGDQGLLEQSTQRVDEGAVLIGRAGESIHEIVDAVQRVTTIVGEISSASQEQSQTVAGYCASTRARIDGLMFDCAMLPP